MAQGWASHERELHIVSEGDIVMVLGGFDQKIRKNEGGENAYGTVIGFLMDEVVEGRKPQKMIMVLLSNGEIWRGPRHLVAPADEQKRDASGEAEERT